jgi:hypothetical protein
MKVKEKEHAMLLRQQGKSMNEIVQIVGASKASVSHWVRDVVLTEQQKSGLSARGRSRDSIEKRRISRIQNTKNRDLEVIRAAKNEIDIISKRDLWMFGIALYLGEGGKANRGTARIASSDPDIIQIAIRFFKEICVVPDYKLRGQIHAYENADIEKIENHWSATLGIPRAQFYKTYTKQSIASKQKRKTTPYGTFQLNIHDTTLYLKMMAWIEKVKELVVE